MGVIPIHLIWNLCIPPSSLSLLSPSPFSQFWWLWTHTYDQLWLCRSQKWVRSSEFLPFSLLNFSPCRKLISLSCRNLLFKQKDVSPAFLHFSLTLVWATDARGLCAKEKGLIQSLVFRALLLAHHSVPYIPVVIPTNWKTSPGKSQDLDNAVTVLEWAEVRQIESMASVD